MSAAGLLRRFPKSTSHSICSWQRKDWLGPVLNQNVKQRILKYYTLQMILISWVAFWNPSRVCMFPAILQAGKWKSGLSANAHGEQTCTREQLPDLLRALPIVQEGHEAGPSKGASQILHTHTRKHTGTHTDTQAASQHSLGETPRRKSSSAQKFVLGENLGGR